MTLKMVGRELIRNMTDEELTNYIDANMGDEANTTGWLAKELARRLQERVELMEVAEGMSWEELKNENDRLEDEVLQLNDEITALRMQVPDEVDFDD